MTPIAELREQMAGTYRIRWANVQVANGYRLVTHRMCIAERRRRWFGWWPCINADWRYNEDQARDDIDRDRELIKPLPGPTVVS